MQPSTDTSQTPATPELIGMLPLKELAAILVRHNGLHEGLYNVSVEFQIAVGSVGPADTPLPGALFGVSRIGLAKVDQVGPHTIDAVQVNPKRATRKKSSASTA